MNLPMNRLALTVMACVFAFCTAIAPLSAQTFTVVHGFDLTDGQNPLGLGSGD
jgi:hypothetical protein